MRLAALAIAAACAASLTACGDTLQGGRIPHNLLEEMVTAPFPVYWLGGSFDGKAVTEVSHDPGGAFAVQYGDCLQGGQGACVPPVRVVTSPDNSFLPGGTTPQHAARVRGVPARVSRAGRTVVIATGPVVVDIYAHDARTATAAAAAMVPINAPAIPRAPLAAALPDTGYGATPLPFQVPSPLHPPG